MYHKLELNLANYTRIFILCSKNISDEDLRKAFNEFGTITDLKYLRDSNGSSKGITYITYTKPSEAARAIEKMNGVMMSGGDRPIKVILASDKSEGNVRAPDEENRMRRLFIVVPDEYEDDLENYFSEFGEVLSVKKLPPNRGKTLAYITFKSSYCAARAIEECSPAFKAVFAQIRSQQTEKGKDRAQPHESGRNSKAVHNNYRETENFRPPVGLMPMHNRRSNVKSTHEVSLHASLVPNLDSRMVNNLFNLAPGLISCHYNSSNGEAILQYSSEDEANFVIQRFPHFQYPPNCPISIYSNNLCNETVPNIQNLVQTIEKATNLLQQAGLMPNKNLKSGVGIDYGFDLPPRQPVLPDSTPSAERLFIVTAPGQLSLEILEDLFCRFGNLLTYNYIGNKTYGYVRYATIESAHNAIRALHKKTVMGMFLKVILADPPSKEEYAGKRKNISTHDETQMGYKYSKTD